MNYTLIFALAFLTLIGCNEAKEKKESQEIAETETTIEKTTIPVSEANFAHAETARNYKNWVALGANKNIVHMRKLPPRGKAAPTVQMNDDTFYSIVISEAVEGRVQFFIPESDVYMAVQVVTEGGHGQHYVVDPGEYDLAVESDFVFLIYRTGVEKGFEAARTAQDKIKTDMFKFGTYQIANYDFEEVEAWTARLTKETSGAVFAYTFPRTSKDITDQHQWNLENANGWGGSSPEVNVANLYTNSIILDGKKSLSTTFENPGSKYFTSITAYDESRYLMEGVKNVNSHTWEENEDGTITVSFNGGDNAINNIDTHGQNFSFTMRYYGVSQKVIDGKVTPEKTVK